MVSKLFDASTVKSDALAGLVVFLVALPLCLGIALASGAPIIAGLVTGIVAGLVVTLLSGSELSVSGPAAGLTVIVATAIAQLGSFEVFAGAVLLSGVFQILLGLLRAGTLSAFFPSSVIHGMLAAIGITIILKQIPHAVGYDADYEGDLDFWNVTDKENTFSEIYLAMQSVSGVAMAIAVIGLVLLVYWPRLQKTHRALEYVPGALAVVVVGMGINLLAGLVQPAWALTGNHLVTLPDTAGLSFLWENFHLPSWRTLTRGDVLTVSLTIALVGSIESLLSLEAVDKLDPRGRVSDTNRELLAQGAGNFLCGLLGGIPMTAVIVRSSTNVYAGGQTRASGFFHGVFLLLCVVLLGSVLSRIPLAALAAILIAVGYKLTSPAIFRKVRGAGLEQFTPFMVTIAAVVLTDLLKGVLIGLAVAFILLIKTTVYGAIIAVRDDKNYYIKFTKDVSFSNKAYLRKVLNAIPAEATVFLDGTKAMFIDHDIYEMIEEFRSRARTRNVQVELIEVGGKSFHLVTRKRKKVHEELPRTTAAV